MEKYLYLIFTVLLCVLPRNIVSRAPSNINDDDDNRIVGGYNTTIQEFPYQAYLVIYQGIQTFQCGGSIINSHYILTAAHCIIQGATMIRARIGSTNADSGGTQYTALFFAAHPLYNRTTFDYDVAYAYIMPRMVLDGINARAVRLAPRGRAVAPGTTLTVSGWGTTMENGNVVQNLMAVQVPVISSEQCNQTYSTITPRMICAGVPEGGKDSCQGDSGGPGVSDEGIQIAIVSYGVGCGRPGYPGVYTNVSSVRRWIRRTTGV